MALVFGGRSTISMLFAPRRFRSVRHQRDLRQIKGSTPEKSHAVW
jgi:hypothetical protein